MPEYICSKERKFRLKKYDPKIISNKKADVGISIFGTENELIHNEIFIIK